MTEEPQSERHVDYGLREEKKRKLLDAMAQYDAPKPQEHVDAKYLRGN